MSEISTEPLSDSSHSGLNVSGSTGPSSPRGALMKWFVVLFLIFLVLGIYSFIQRRTAHQVLAQQTIRLSVPYVGVIHATAISGEAELILPGDIQSYVDSPIYARTNGYLK